MWTVNVPPDALEGSLSEPVGGARIIDLLTLLGFAVPGGTTALASSLIIGSGQPESIALMGNLIFVGVLTLFAVLGWIACKLLDGRHLAAFFVSLFAMAGCNIWLASHGWQAAAIETMAGWGAPAGNGLMATTLFYLVVGLMVNLVFYLAWCLWAKHRASVANSNSK